MISLLHVISLDGTQYHLRDNLDVISPHSTPRGRVSVVMTIFHYFTKILLIIWDESGGGGPGGGGERRVSKITPYFSPLRWHQKHSCRRTK